MDMTPLPGETALFYSIRTGQSLGAWNTTQDLLNAGAINELQAGELAGELNICPDIASGPYKYLVTPEGKCRLYNEEASRRTRPLWQPLLTVASVIPSGGLSLIGTSASGVSQLVGEPLPQEVSLGLKAATIVAGGAPVNGFGDIFGDLGAFFTTEQTLWETVSNVGSDIWGGVSSLLPTVAPTLAAPLISTALAPLRRAAPAPLPVPGWRGGTPVPLRPAVPQYSPFQYVLPEFMRTPTEPGYTGDPPGSQPPGQWEIDTYGEPGTMGGVGAMTMLPAVRGMGTLALRATVNAMRSQGLAASVSWLAGVIRKFGPAAAVGFLASWVEDQIAQRAVFEAYGHKGRRMNPANTRALRRSLRRLQSFDRLACRVQAQLYAGPARSRARRRCQKCRKSPCRC